MSDVREVAAVVERDALRATVERVIALVDQGSAGGRFGLALPRTALIMTTLRNADQVGRALLAERA